MAVIAALMGLPETDLELLQHAAYATVAPTDPHYRTGSPDMTRQWAHATLVDYFATRLRERPATPGPDLLSHLLAIRAGGRPLSPEEVVLNCHSLLVGGVVTTAQVILAALAAVAGPAGGHWPTSLDVSSFTEEATRWASPITHFMRTARHDCLIGGVQVRAGDPVAAWIASANRD